MRSVMAGKTWQWAGKALVTGAAGKLVTSHLGVGEGGKPGSGVRL